MDKTVTLHNGIQMPIIGLGTWRSRSGGETKQAVLWALEAGYRHIDTATIYGNEEDIGKALKESGIPREEIFITTKLWNEDHGDVESALKESLKKLQTEYVDLYLIHWPTPQRKESWKALEELYQQGLCKAIGVSNFTIRHLKDLLEVGRVIPMVNQVEFTPFLYQKELYDFCQEYHIKLEGYRPLTAGKKLDHPLLVELGKKYSKSPAQILIRWNIEHDVVVIPKSVNQGRIQENFDVDFSISSEDMEKLNALNEDLRFASDPANLP